MKRLVARVLTLIMTITLVSAYLSGQAMSNLYGTSIGIDAAKKAASAAVAEARKNGWMMAISIVDTAGNQVYFEKMDGTQTGSVSVAVDKARSAALFQPPSRVFQDNVAGGGAGFRILGLPGAVPFERG